MDPVHERGSMDAVHESSPWTRSKVGVHGPLVHVLSSPGGSGANGLKLCGQPHFCLMFHETCPSCLGSMYMYILQLYCVTNTIHYFSL